MKGEKRPKLDNNISAKDFADFYWLKEELVSFCRSEGLTTSGGKIEIAERIEHFLRTGKVKEERKNSKAKSSFDWNTSVLSLDTVITDNYKNSENVRSFFENQIGDKFKFNVIFMNWIKANAGKTLADAARQYQVIATENKERITKKEIAPQFEYNTYLRDFLADNPTATRGDGIKLWKIKRALRGSNAYSSEDLKFLD